MKQNTKFFQAIFFLLLISTQLYGQQQKVWLDADTGNEMDDVFAIIHLLSPQQQVDIVGLSSAHFNNADLVSFEKWNQYTTPGIQPVRISQGLNREILATMGLEHIPHPMGADRQMGRAWGGYEPRPSSATEQMLEVISTLGADEKLDILSLGALTNIASLIAIDSTVKDKIRVYSLGGNYNVETKAWNKNEFNVRCDLNAFDFMLNQTGLDWTVMPIGTVIGYRFDRDETYAMLNEEDPVEQLMIKRWRETNPEDQARVLWDLGLVQAYLKPALAEQSEVLTPPENHQHKVTIYAQIDSDAMHKDFWDTIEANR